MKKDMMEILTGRSKLIYDILASEDFDPEELKAELESGHYSPDELNRAACAYAFQCMDDYNTLGDDRTRGEIVPGYISSHFYDAIEIMLASAPAVCLQLKLIKQNTHIQVANLPWIWYNKRKFEEMPEK